MIDVGLFSAYILFGLCAIASIVLPLIKALDDPDSLKKSLLGIGVLAVIIIISYVLADGTPYGGASASASKWVGTGIYTFYILSIAAIGAIIYSEVKKAIG